MSSEETVPFRTTPSLEDEEDDDEFEDALNDLGHLSLADEEEETFCDPGLPHFAQPLMDNESQGFITSTELTAQTSFCDGPTDLTCRNSVSPIPHSEESNSRGENFERASDECALGADSGYISQSNGETMSEQSLPELSKYLASAHCSSRDQLVFDHCASRTESSASAALSSDFDMISETDDSTTYLNESTEFSLPDQLPSSSGMDDFTCDLPTLSDDVTGDEDATDTEDDTSTTVRPPVFEVDEEEEQVRRLESQWTEEEKEERKLEANGLKSRGNQAFKSDDFDQAEDLYTQALSVCPTCFPNDRSIIYSNRSACKLRKGQDEASLKDCTRALKLNPDYVKCLLRRAELLERAEKLDESLTDYKHVYELDKSIHVAAAAIMRLEQMINERNEKMKEEMLGQLKNLGNMILKPFGLSTQNFQLEQDPGSGGYSINFQR